MMDYILVAGLLVLPAWMGWALICNERTFQQRIRLLYAMRAITGSREYWLLSKQFDAVSYGQHVRAFMLLRDPMKLYGKELQAAYRNLIEVEPEQKSGV